MLCMMASTIVAKNIQSSCLYFGFAYTFIAPTRIGDYCEDRSWCEFGLNVQCDGNRCTCRQGYITNATLNGCVERESVRPWY
ncbi:hypothetical protein DPMN_127628 [Dreissena polymorpha]|uniref:EB domain-containing protein n=1 Tax=Dreissena polymorpha TaxID=45954 RepID=A0A9D4GZK5_DREPO|nr:hypothetical protein DPMN_127628 [Dreissena polymorpha]